MYYFDHLGHLRWRILGAGIRDSGFWDSNFRIVRIFLDLHFLFCIGIPVLAFTLVALANWHWHWFGLLSCSVFAVFFLPSVFFFFATSCVSPSLLTDLRIAYHAFFSCLLAVACRRDKLNITTQHTQRKWRLLELEFPALLVGVRTCCRTKVFTSTRQHSSVLATTSRESAPKPLWGC